MKGRNVIDQRFRFMGNRFEMWTPPEIENNKLTKWNWMCQHKDKLKLGKHVDIGAFTYINAAYGVIIQDYAQIGSHCSIYSISTIDGKSGEVVVQSYARIGSHSLIMPDVTIGENAIVGAFSFVNRDIPRNVLAHGIPVQVVRDLSDEDFKRFRREGL
jgi:acetyltransferase-like isoleucine patch superfamily enzyme